MFYLAIKSPTKAFLPAPAILCFYNLLNIKERGGKFGEGGFDLFQKDNTWFALALFIHVLRIPKVSIFMAVTPKKGSKLTKNGIIFAKNALKWQGQGTKWSQNR